MLNSTHQKPIRSVPSLLIGLLVFSLLLQIVWHRYSVTTQINREPLSSAPSHQQLAIAALGEPEVLAKILMLWVQSLDNQPGISLALKDFNYDHLIDWLQVINQLDIRSEYTLFSATHFYTSVAEPEKQRKILHFIEQQFKQNPNHYWRWLAHASIIARHRLHDNELALRYAQLLRKQVTSPYVPHWAKQLELVILEENGEYESIKLLIGGLLSEGKITDPHELLYLNQFLEQMKNKSSK